ncbi:hypothetical protein WJX82_000006 [Trebouxia sp. C0006]
MSKRPYRNWLPLHAVSLPPFLLQVAWTFGLISGKGDAYRQTVSNSGELASLQLHAIMTRDFPPQYQPHLPSTPQL